MTPTRGRRAGPEHLLTLQGVACVVRRRDEHALAELWGSSGGRTGGIVGVQPAASALENPVSTAADLDAHVVRRGSRAGGPGRVGSTCTRSRLVPRRFRRSRAPVVLASRRRVGQQFVRGAEQEELLVAAARIRVAARCHPSVCGADLDFAGRARHAEELVGIAQSLHGSAPPRAGVIGHRRLHRGEIKRRRTGGMDGPPPYPDVPSRSVSRWGLTVTRAASSADRQCRRVRTAR